MQNFPSVLEKVQDLNHEQINGLLSLASQYKQNPEQLLGKTLLPNRKAVIANSFFEHSTRTKNSFALAANHLGCTYIDFQADASSLKKGESLEETLLTLYAQGVDLCVIRTSETKAFTQFKDSPPIKIINGGDGTHEHPTQALVDLFTMQELDLPIRGKTMAVIGDCRHSRVTHSLIHLLPQFGLNLVLCGPEHFLPEEDLPQGVTCVTDLDEAMNQADYLYALRIQKERHLKGTSGDLASDQSYHEQYGLNLNRLKKRPEIPVFHPGPANIGVEIDQGLMRSSHYKAYEQVKNSIFMRMAIMAAALQNNDKNIGKVNGKSLRDA